MSQNKIRGWQKNKRNYLVPLDNKGDLIEMTNSEFPRYFESAARKRTQYLGLIVAIGQISMPDALKAAYVQGMHDLQNAQSAS